ncbi:hypothetical protein BS78_04G042400 [Paspalum vaginatum]|nr:hypothetical protein BS78_04G042400 [Paspalum vaginatum]
MLAEAEDAAAQGCRVRGRLCTRTPSGRATLTRTPLVPGFLPGTYAENADVPMAVRVLDSSEAPAAAWNGRCRVLAAQPGAGPLAVAACRPGTAFPSGRHHRAGHWSPWRLWTCLARVAVPTSPSSRSGRARGVATHGAALATGEYLVYFLNKPDSEN